MTSEERELQIKSYVRREASCGLEGSFMAMEKSEKDVSFHFNMYGIEESGNEVLFTKDHIIPKSKGGSNQLSNYQTMCVNCNQNKRDNL